MTERFKALEITDLGSAQIEEVRRLKVSRKQAEFGGSFEHSLDTCLRGSCETLRGYCFLQHGAFIGMGILKRPPSSPNWVPADAVSLHALKIDRRVQGLGLGRKAFVLASCIAISSWPDARQLVLAVDAENTAAVSLYRKSGMHDSGPIYRGRIGHEHRMSKRFAG